MKDDLRAPKLYPQDIKPIVDRLRAQYPTLQRIPIDVETFIEFDLELEIVPCHDICEKVSAEAIITRDFGSIMVDAVKFLRDEYAPRLRFSLAHELGHMFLHSEWINKNIPPGAEPWIAHMSGINETTYIFLESQAHYFAGMLLVPAEELLPMLSGTPPSIATIARHFEVSAEVIARRIVTFDVKEAWEAS